MVALPIPVKIETLSGARKSETERLGRLLSTLPILQPTEATWKGIESWVILDVMSGQRFGIGDLLVGRLATERDYPVWSLDHDFTRMARLGLVTLGP